MTEETVLLGGSLRQPALGERFAATPRLACETLARALNTGDLEEACACFAPGACLIDPEGREAHGEGPIRTLLARLIADGTEVSIELAGVTVSGDLALAHERWRIGSGTGHSRLPRSVHPTLVLRLVGGEWRLAIAAPWGREPVAGLVAI